MIAIQVFRKSKPEKAHISDDTCCLTGPEEPIL